jgi:hypothetical protein
MLTGSGIFIIENYKNKRVVVLFGNDEEYNDLGGKIDHGESSIDSACREAREESCNLFKFKPEQIRNISVPVQHRNYMSYFIYIKNLSLKNYYHNKNIIYGNCDRNIHHYWMETNKAARIDLDVLIENSLKNNNIMYDINGNKIQVRMRVVDLMNNAIKKGVFNKLIIPKDLYPKLTIQSKMKCLIGTHTYVL